MLWGKRRHFSVFCFVLVHLAEADSAYSFFLFLPCLFLLLLLFLLWCLDAQLFRCYLWQKKPITYWIILWSKLKKNQLTLYVWVYYSQYCSIVCCCCLVTKLYLTFCDSMNCSPPCSSLHRISHARILEWDAISFSRQSSWPRDCTYISCLACGFFSTELPGRSNFIVYVNTKMSWLL